MGNAKTLLIRWHGTDNKGERHGNSRLTEQDVQVIRHLRNEMGVTLDYLANLYGVANGHITASLLESAGHT